MELSWTEVTETENMDESVLCFGRLAHFFRWNGRFLIFAENQK